MQEPERMSETPEPAPRPNVFRSPHTVCAGAWAVAWFVLAAFSWDMFVFGPLGWGMALLAWSVLGLAGLGLLASTLFSSRARTSWVVWTCLCAGAVCAYESQWVGAVSRVLRFEGSYRARATAALSGSRPGANRHADGSVLPLIVDDDAKPKRAAITWLAAHGDWAGVVYDPAHVTGASQDGSWLWGSRFVHLFGPWYFAHN